MDYKSLSDEVLVREMTKKSEGAFKELFERYSRKVYNIVYSYVNEGSAAEDISQEIFVSVYEKSHSFRFKSKFSTWLYRISVNKSLNYLRKLKREKLQFDLKDAEAISEEYEDADDFRNTKNAELILQSLPESQRTAFILTQRESLKYKEAAEIMRISERSLEGLLYRARENIIVKIHSLKRTKNLKEIV